MSDEGEQQRPRPRRLVVLETFYGTRFDENSGETCLLAADYFFALPDEDKKLHYQKIACLNKPTRCPYCDLKMPAHLLTTNHLKQCEQECLRLINPTAMEPPPKRKYIDPSPSSPSPSTPRVLSQTPSTPLTSATSHSKPTSRKSST